MIIKLKGTSMHRLIILLVVAVALLLLSCADKKSEEEYFKAGYDHYNKTEYTQALDNFKQVLKNYPDGDYEARAMFMIGFINANNTQDLEEAKKYYQMFIDKYTDHELVASARYELETLGKDIDELPIFKKIEGGDSLEVAE